MPVPHDAHHEHDATILAHMPLVRRIAATIFGIRAFDGVPFEDYMQFGAEGLIQAVRRYDPDLGAKFETYAGHRIKGAILSGLEKSTEINQQVSTMRRMAQERIDSLINQGMADSNAKLGPQASFDRLVEVSLGLAVAFMLDDTALFHGSTPTHWDDGAANLAYKQLRQRLMQAVQQLASSEQKVLEKHYFEHDSFEFIAQNLGLTPGRVSQLHRSALGKLRTALAARQLGELIG